MSPPSSTGISRRTFLELTLASLAGSVVQMPQARAGTPPRGEKVLVLGAGMAGLAAAVELTARGFSVVVIEGRDRIGGRIHTDHTKDHIALDLGASWIHKINGNPIHELAQRDGVKILPTDYDSIIRYGPAGKPLAVGRDEESWALYRRLTKAVAHLQHDAKPRDSLGGAIESVIAGLNLTAEQRADLACTINTEIEADYGAAVGDLSLAEWDQDVDFAGPDALIPGGYDQIVNRLATGLDIRLGQVVSSVAYGADGVMLTTGQGTFTAEKAIVTLPLGVLKSGAVTFLPALPAAKQRAIDRLHMGLLNKLYLRFPSVFWPKEKQLFGYLSRPPGHWAEWYNLERTTGQPILVVFTAEAQAVELEKLSDAETVASAMTVLRKIFGTIPEPIDYRVTRWNADPFAGGSYSHIPPGASSADYEALAETVDNRLFFAGEATSRKYPQTVHGAYLSGVRAAKCVAGLIR